MTFADPVSKNRPGVRSIVALTTGKISRIGNAIGKMAAQHVNIINY
jgi:hypothetical protein